MRRVGKPMKVWNFISSNMVILSSPLVLLGASLLVLVAVDQLSPILVVAVLLSVPVVFFLFGNFSHFW